MSGKFTPGGRKIEEFLDLPPLEEALGVNTLDDDHADDLARREAEYEAERAGLGEALDEAQALAERAKDQMVMLEGTDHGEAMDVIHHDVKKHAADLIDLAFNSDSRSTARIAEVAAQMYKIAIDAKNSKRDMQLKAMKLALDRQRVELERVRMGESPSGTGISGEVQAQGVVIEDRNELIRRAREQMLRKDEE